MGADDLTGPPTDDTPRLPAPRPNGLFAGPRDAPDQFELLGEGIRGGEGITWRARYVGALRSPVPLAIKMLNRPRTSEPGWPSPQLQQRWKDQTVLLHHVHMEHVVSVHEIFVGPPPHGRGRAGDTGVAAYVSMEWVDGHTLAELCAGHPASAATIDHRLHYVAGVAAALQEMHTATRKAGNPSVHRDLKPGNCIVHPGRGVVLIDLSGMRALDDDFDPTGLHTPAYTAPEVLRHPHGRREPSSDLYALGALAVFCLIGDDPPPAGAAAADRIAPRLREVARAAGVAQPDAFAAHLLAMLRADPASRPADGPAWAAELQRLGALSLGVRPDRRGHRRRVTVTAVAALIVAGAAGTALALPDTPRRPAQPPAAAPATTAISPTGAAPRPTTTTNSAAISPAQSATTAPPPTTGARVPRTTATPAGRPRSTTAPPATGTPPRVAAAGTISSPGTGAAVLNCAYFSGTSRLPSGRTLILAMRNLDNGDPNYYVETVFGWDEPGRLASWRGAQYFGGAAGQHYRVDLMHVSLSAAKAAGRDTDANNALADDGVRLASRDVVKQEGTTGDDCPGP